MNGVFLLALCFTIFIESITRIVEPEMIKEPRNVLIVGVIGLVINLIGMCMFHGHAHGHSHGVENTNSHIDGEASHLMTSHPDRAFALADLSPSDEIVATAPKKSKCKSFPFNFNNLSTSIFSGFWTVEYARSVSTCFK